MQKTQIYTLPEGLPQEFEQLCNGARIFDSSCSRQARVYFIDREEGYYLKTAKRGELFREAQMTEYFCKKGLGAGALSYISRESDWMLTPRVLGEDCTCDMYMSDPKRLCDITATLLRSLHEVDFSDCPVKDKMSDYIDRAERNFKTDNYSKEHFPDNFGYRTADEAYAALQKGKSALQEEVLLHGDYCFPNIMLDDWRFSGFIDIGGGGVGDRHIDLFWGAWSLSFNLGTDEYKERFFDAYGRDKIVREKLDTVAAAEVFR